MIFCPALILVGLETRVATATGMYLTLYTTLSSSLQLLIMKRIPLDYMAYVLVMTLLGTGPGIFFQTYLVKSTGRLSYTVVIFTSCLLISAFSVSAINIPLLVHRS